MKPQSDLTGLAVDEVGMLLLRSAQLVRERGWCQRSYGFNGGPVCAVGAIYFSGKDSDRYVSARKRLEDYVKAPPSSWNDAPGRTADEVIAALTAAALSHAAQG